MSQPEPAIVAAATEPAPLAASPETILNDSAPEPTTTEALLREVPIVSKRHPYLALDAWRGIASLWVVMIHACLPIYTGRYPELARQPFYAFSLRGALGVQLFFVISGYCIASAAASALRKENALVTFIKARVRRIYPPYFFAAMATVVVSLLAAHFLEKAGVKNSALGSLNVLHQHPLWYFSNLTLTQTPLHQTPLIDVFWTLNYEVAFYALVAVSLFARTERRMLNGLHLLTIASLGVLLVFPKQTPFPFDLWPQFGFGAMVYDLLSNPKEKLNKIALGIAGLETVAFVGLYRIGGGIGHVSSRAGFTVALAFAFVLLVLHRYDRVISANKIVQGLSWVGIFSYSLYLTHQLCRGVVLQIGKKAHITEHNYLISFAAQLIVSVLVARLFYQFFERPFTIPVKPKPTVTLAKASV